MAINFQIDLLDLVYSKNLHKITQTTYLLVYLTRKSNQIIYISVDLC